MSKTRILKSNPYKNTTLSSKVIHALATGKGITWLDSVRIPYKSSADKNEACRESRGDQSKGFGTGNWGRQIDIQGRFPANLLCSDDILNDGTTTKSNPHPRTSNPDKMYVFGKYGRYTDQGGWNDSGSYSRYFDLDKWWNTLLERIKNENSDL